MWKYIIFIVPVIILDLLAIHDIVKGVEPDYREEYICLVFSVIIFALIIFRYFHVKKIKN